MPADRSNLPSHDKRMWCGTPHHPASEPDDPACASRRLDEKLTGVHDGTHSAYVPLHLDQAVVLPGLQSMREITWRSTGDFGETAQGLRLVFAYDSQQCAAFVGEHLGQRGH